MTDAAATAEAPATRASSLGDGILLVTVLVGSWLRLWDLGRVDPIIDETYTALSVRLPTGQMLDHLDRTDPHPPLAYLVLKPFSALVSDIGSLRAVSAVAGVAAVVVMALWMRSRGVTGLVATALFALSPFQLTYVREFRMYGLLSLTGVVAAWCADRWLADGRRGWAVGAAAAGGVVALSHAAGVVLLVALLAVPLLRSDRAAWFFRSCTGAALGVFALLAGTHALRWSRGSGALPTASLSWASIVANELVAPAPDERWLVLPALLLGAVLLVRRRDALARLWVCLFAVPFAVLYLSSLRRGVLVPRSLMPFSWGAPLALGALAGWAWDRSRAVGGAVVAVLALAVLPLVGPALRQDEGTGAAMRTYFAEAAPGDGFAYIEGSWQPDSLIRFYGPAGLEPVPSPAEALAVLSAGGDRPARAWFLAMPGNELPAGVERCGPTVALHRLLEATCVVLPPSGSGS